jgi:hypothetical protein
MIPITGHVVFALDLGTTTGYAIQSRDDNKADALAILLWAIETNGGVW